MFRMPARSTPLLLAGTIAWTIACPAVPQGALDAGLQVGTKANAAAKQEDFRSRNLVVTGDVAAGRGFRGSVGYSAEGDFRAATGSDASIDFRRNSALSNPALATGSVGAGASFSIGRDSVSSLEYRRDFVGPGSSGAAATSATSDATRSRLDRMSTRLTSSELRELEGQSTPMARYQGREGDQGVLSVSEVRGVKKERDRDNLTGERLSLYEAARLREDLRNGLLRMDAVRPKSTNPFVIAGPADAVTTSSVRDIAAPSRADAANRPAGSTPTQYDRIIREIEANWRERSGRAEQPERPEGAPPVDERKPSIDDAYERLRRELGARDESFAPTEPKTGVEIKPTEPTRQVELGGAKLSLDDYALILKHSGTIDAFGDGGQSRLDELLAEGQRAMHQGNSFVAEKRFEVAMTMKPGDPRCKAGMLHCQIGANLAGSAAITLRSLLSSHPEMIDVRYGEQAVPPRARIERAMATTRERIARSASPVDDGLLLAYLGHLTGDRAAIQEGLSHMKGKPQDETLRQLVEKIWLAPDAKPGIEPAAASAP